MIALDYEVMAKEAAGNHRKFDCFGWYERPDDDLDWCIVYTHNRDSGLLDQSNADQIAEMLEPFIEQEEPDVIPEHHGHWAVGWVDGYAIRVINDGLITDAFKAWCDIQERLSDYPVLDEEDHSRREYEATCENIEQVAGSVASKFDLELPEGYAGTLFSWFWDNDQGAVECRDDGGGYPSDEEMEAAFYGLGWLVECESCNGEGHVRRFNHRLVKKWLSKLKHQNKLAGKRTWGWCKKQLVRNRWWYKRTDTYCPRCGGECGHAWTPPVEEKPA